MKVTIDLEECIGCGSCTAMCEKHWEMDEETMKAHLKTGKKTDDAHEEAELPDSELACNMEAAESCPVNCIHIFVDDEKKI